MRSNRLRPAIVVLLAMIVASHAFGQGTLIPVRARRDMVFDHSGTFLYISTGDGFVRRFNLALPNIFKPWF